MAPATFSNRQNMKFKN